MVSTSHICREVDKPIVWITYLLAYEPDDRSKCWAKVEGFLLGPWVLTPAKKKKLVTSNDNEGRMVG